MLARVMAVALAATLAFGAAAAAPVTFKQYKEPKDESERRLNATYLSGVSDGLLSVNAILQSEGRLRVFCPPPTLTLTESQADDILKRAAKEVSNPDLTPIAALLTEGLKSRFPCK